MAANGSVLATSWQLNGIGLAADGCGRGRKWQRIGSFLATNGSTDDNPALGDVSNFSTHLMHSGSAKGAQSFDHRHMSKQLHIVIFRLMMSRAVIAVPVQELFAL